MNVLNGSVPKAQGGCLHNYAPNEVTATPPSPAPPPQAPEADSCFTGRRPFTHSRPGSQPRHKRPSACLSNVAEHSLHLLHHLLPRPSVVRGDGSLLAPDNSFRMELTAGQAGKQRSPHRLPEPTQEAEGLQGRRGSSYKYSYQGLALALEAGKCVPLKTGQTGRTWQGPLPPQDPGWGPQTLGFPFAPNSHDASELHPSIHLSPGDECVAFTHSFNDRPVRAYYVSQALF